MPLRLRAIAAVNDRLLAREVASLTPAQLARARAGVPTTGPVGRVFGRATQGVPRRDITVAGDGGARLRARVYGPAADATATTATLAGAAAAGSPTRTGGAGTQHEGSRPLLVHLHGGGWVVGNHTSAAWLCTGLAAATGAVVVSVDYRMAPEHRFPTAALDCHAATADLVARAEELGVDPDRVAVTGDSAGGNLAAVVCLLARESGPRISAQALVYPATDATLSSPSVQRLAHAPILDLDDIRGYRGHYLGPDGDPTDPRVSPLLAASHAGLPPALVQTAEHDPLVDDGRRYADALAAAGVEVRYTRYEGMPHGFLSIPGASRAAAHQARAEIAGFLSSVWSRPAR